MVVEAHKLGYEDYLRMPEDGRKYEILQGELYVAPSPSRTHQKVLRNLVLPLTSHIEQYDLGELYFAPLAVRLTPDEPVEPDILFVLKNRLSIIAESGVRGAPDLIIEILSPSKPRYDRVTKFNRYLQVGVPEYWIVDPIAQTIEQFVLEDGRYVPIEPIEENVVGSLVIAGLHLSMSSVFRPQGDAAPDNDPVPGFLQPGP